MAWKRLTFILIPHSRENIRQMRVHRGLIYALSVFLIAAIGIMIFYITGFKSKSFVIDRTRELTNKNQVLMEHISIYDSTLVSMSAQIAHLESINASIVEESEISEMDLKLLGNIELDAFIDGANALPERILGIINRIEQESEAFEQNFLTLFEHCEDNSDFIKHVPSIRPCEGFISKEFGRAHDHLLQAEMYSGQSAFGLSYDRPSQPERTHTGVDIHNVEGTPVVATADGVIEEITFSGDLGRYITIDHQNGYTTRYAHLQNVTQMKNKIRLKKGESVTRGQQIGSIGRTGISIPAISAHLMYSIYHHGIPVNPTDYFFAADFAASLQAGSSGAQRNAPHPG